MDSSRLTLRLPTSGQSLQDWWEFLTPKTRLLVGSWVGEQVRVERMPEVEEHQTWNAWNAWNLFFKEGGTPSATTQPSSSPCCLVGLKVVSMPGGIEADLLMVDCKTHHTTL